jgi:hypothetical protein
VVVLVGQRRVDLVGEHCQVVLPGERRDLPELLAGHRRTCRVVRVAEHEVISLARPVLGQQVGGERERLRLTGRDRQDLAACEQHARDVGDVRRLDDGNRVAGIDQRTEGEVEPLARPSGHEDLRLRIVTQVVPGRHPFGDCLAEVTPSPVHRVGGLAAFE